MSDPFFNDKFPRHYKTRAVGQLYVGPLQAQGYDNKVISATISDVEFRNSYEAQRYMDALRRRYANRKDLCRQHRMKFYANSSD